MPATKVERWIIVSIHVPLAEHDQASGTMRQAPAVSIHVPLAEHDEILRPAVEECLSFNSRAPRGARRNHRQF